MATPWTPFGWTGGARRGLAPQALSGLRAWYRSDLGITIATGVSQWNDLSGNGNHLLQAAGPSQPTRTLGVINGSPAIVFSAASTMAASFTLGQPSTLFAVVRADTWGDTNTLFDGVAAGASAMVQQFTASANVRLVAGAAGVDGVQLPVSTFALLVATFNGASSSIKITDGTQLNGTLGADNPNGLTVGSRAGGTAFANISVAEIIVTATSATAAERTSIRTYVQQRYAF
jgi:hypothetical protein